MSAFYRFNKSVPKAVVNTDFSMFSNLSNTSKLIRQKIKTNTRTVYRKTMINNQNRLKLNI